MNITVTGASGQLGNLVLQHLKTLAGPQDNITGLIRNPEKAAAIETLGFSWRTGDYNDLDSLVSAFKGTDRLMFISASEVGKRIPQHRNVIEAAKAAGVGQIVYTSIIQADTSQNPLAPEHKETEQLLAASGIDRVILRNNWYLENFAGDIRAAAETGVLAAAVGDGKTAAALRSEYAEAAARVLTGSGHSGKVYELAGKPFGFADLAEAISAASGKQVQYTPVSPDQRKEMLLSSGMDEGTADFVVMLDAMSRDGSLSYSGPDLAMLLGRNSLALDKAVSKILHS